mmetsp:Transcript_36757/g.84860  ORF Transcript_36757/g.84860 Transcript_36757/m.84860 type:complete len:451 (-) Transcript_36757:113-1465(-)
MSSPVRRKPGAEESARCQYFVLSPRHSLDSPHRPDTVGDENVDQNVVRQAVVKVVKKGSKFAKAKASGARKPAVLARQATPPKRRPAESAAAKTPVMPLTARTPVVRSPRTPKVQEVPAPNTARTPATQEGKRLEDADDLCPSVCSEKFSMYSETSTVSRLTQLSRKSLSRRCLSSQELEEIQVMEKRREVSAMMRRNQVNCRKALHATDLSSAGRVQSDVKLTQPREFHLSCPPTPRSPGSPLPSCAEDADDCESVRGDFFPRMLRSSRSCQSLESAKSWKPQLTVPKGPDLRTVRRLSAGRRPNSCPPEEEAAAPVHTKTPRHRVEVRRPVDMERRQLARTPAKMLVTPVSRPAMRPATSTVKGVEQGRGTRKPRPNSPQEKPQPCVIKRSPSDELLLRTPGALSPSFSGGLSLSRSSKLLQGGFGGGHQPPGLRVSFGSTTPRPCCL